MRPLEVFAEVARVLRPGAPFVVTFSNRLLPHAERRADATEDPLFGVWPARAG